MGVCMEGGWSCRGDEGGHGYEAAAPQSRSVCCIRHSGTVDVQRLAVLRRSMQHAEAHTFFQCGWVWSRGQIHA